ncbi:MAG: methylmalonyl-CoA mutase family protein [Pseudomonadota bacterium]
MSNDRLTISSEFPEADESAWIQAVNKALKGAGPEKLERTTADGLTVKPLYRESDWPSATDPLGTPGEAPFLRGPHLVRNASLPWDIRQSFAHPDPTTTNAEILHDLSGGVSSVELVVDPTGANGCAVANPSDMAKTLMDVDASVATVALEPAGSAAGYGIEISQVLARWAYESTEPAEQILAFNIAPLAALCRLGTLEEDLDSAFLRTAGLYQQLSSDFPKATILRVDSRPIHEAGGSDAQEISGLIAQGIDTLRRLDRAGASVADIAPGMIFSVAIDPNYGLQIAKVRAARRLWARCIETLDLTPHPMNLQAVSSRRMLTRRDPWVNLLRNTAACFAAGAGGADIVTLNPFTDALGVAEELGRRTARNTQIIAQEESQIGRVADPAGGAWFIEAHADTLAEAAWAEFQRIESEGGFGASLEADALQARVAQTRKSVIKNVARRKQPITGVSEFPLLEEIDAPVADLSGWTGASDAVEVEPVTNLPAPDGETLSSPLWPMRLAESFEHLRDHADRKAEATGTRPGVFIATLGPLAEHTARADFARNLFATGGIEAKEPPVPPKDIAELVAAWRASGCVIACLCGSDSRYEAEAAGAASELKKAGVQRLYLAGKHSAEDVDSSIHIGIDVVAALELAHAELGITG